MTRYFSFAFVRNPWDLMVSSYHSWLYKAGKFENRRAQQRTVLGLGASRPSCTRSSGA